jgi:hypothetical protein
MWWLAVAAGCFFFRDKIARVLAPFLPDMDPLRMAFFCHCSMLVGALAYTLPLELVGFAAVKRPAYLASIWSCTGSCMLTLKANYGIPPMPENFSFSNFKQSFQQFSIKLQPWLMKVNSSADFQMLFFSLIFLTAYPSVWVLVIIGRRALWCACTDCAKNRPNARLWLMFAPTWEKLKAQNAKVLEYSSMAEILLGFWLVISIFLPMRQILTCILYWNYVRMRYQGQRSAEGQLKAWKQLAVTAGPVLKIIESTPLRKGLDFAKNWFNQRQG